MIDVGLTKWSLPDLTLIADGERRFSELRNALPETSNRALTLALKDLESAELVLRTVTTGYPPTTSYGATPAGLRLARAAERLQLRTPE